MYDFSVMVSRNFVEVSINLIIGFPEQIFVWVFDSYWLAGQIFDFSLCRLVMRWKR